MTPQLAETVRHEMAKATPGAAVGGATLFGIPLPEVVMYATIAYYAVSVILLIVGKVRTWRNNRE